MADRHEGPVGRVIEVLGQPDAPGVDTSVILRRHGIVEAHSPGAIAEARWMGAEVRPHDCEGRTDFRGDLTVTIDGDDARDFDDAVSVVRARGRAVRLERAHRRRRALRAAPAAPWTEDALDRGTSVYFPDRAVHMFPADLATGLCSLKPGEDRLVQSCVIEIDAGGEPARVAFHDGVIRSARAPDLHGRECGPDGTSRARRPRSTPRSIPMLRADARPVPAASRPAAAPGVDRLRSAGSGSRARRGGAGRRHHGVRAQRRAPPDRGVHAARQRGRRRRTRTAGRPGDLPHPRTARPVEGGAVRRLRGDARATASARLPPRVRPRHFQQLVERVAGTAVERPVAFLMLRTMSAGAIRHRERRPLRPGDAGLHPLHLADQAVSRSRRAPAAARRAARRDRRSRGETPWRPSCRPSRPMRRSASAAPRTPSANWCSGRRSGSWRTRIGEEFDGYVTGVSAFGLFVELVEPFVEGLVHLSTLADDELPLPRVRPRDPRRAVAAGVPARRPRPRAGR
ncbi:MAG: RNB domain-containing ribonuclease [Comamonadaceae bacterium]|nr:RNB domain-containing ribonuclease [Comamonadaceae bacterium]